MFPEYRISVNGGSAPVIGRAVAVDEVRVCDVDCGFVGREAEAVRSSEAVGHDPYVTCRRVESVDQLGQLGFRAETLFVAVDGIGEPDRAVRVHDYVVGGVEGAGVVVVEEGGGFVGAFGFHVDEAGGFAEGALGAEDEAVAVIGAAVGHVVAFGAAYFVAGEVCGGEEFYFCDDYCFVAGGDGVWGIVRKLVGGYKESVCGRVENASLVEVGGPIVFDEALEGGIGPKDREKGIMIDEKGFGLRRRGRHEGCPA